ncbi:MAG: hypothetical protein ACR2IV_05090 [Bryobacteraceae bacterium]
MDISLCHDLFEVAQAERISKISSNAQNDDLGFEMSSFEQRWPVPLHKGPTLSDRFSHFATHPLGDRNSLPSLVEDRLKAMKTSPTFLLLIGLQTVLLGHEASTIKTGPPAGTRVPDFQAIDQNGHLETVASVSGPKGSLLVFFRSADW